MILPGETETGSAGMQPCRGITWWTDRDDKLQRRNLFVALLPNPHRMDRPSYLRIPAPKGGIVTNGERPLSISG
jgi:hypothetical protein